MTEEEIKFANQLMVIETFIKSNPESILKEYIIKLGKQIENPSGVDLSNFFN